MLRVALSTTNDPQRPLAWHRLCSNQTELKIIFCLLPIISFACFCSLSLSSCCSLWLLLLHRGALSWLISWLQPLWRVNWRRRCLYLWIYGPASYPAAVAGGVFTACTRCISFYSWVCMYVFFCLEWNVRRIKFVFFFLFCYPWAVESLVSFVVGPHYTRDSFVSLSTAAAATTKHAKTSLTGWATDGWLKPKSNIKNKNNISCLLHSHITQKVMYK